MTRGTGKVWVFGDNIDTDALAPGVYMKAPIAEMARHCLETVDPAFAANVRPGDIVVGGENFGAGSSREQAVMVLRGLGVSAVVARSFARIFYRNAMNLGLPALVCPDASRLEAGSEVSVDAAVGIVEDRTRSIRLKCEPIPPHLLAMIADGGLLPHLKKTLARKRKGEPTP
jgi:3-isopropylmalate/(R)-2-methylmalate dehydratase small subunit